MKSLKKIISFSTACQIMTFIFTIIIIFHFCALLGFIPMDMIWGGRLKTTQELIVFESISMTLNLIMLIIVKLKSGSWKLKINRSVIQAALWVMVVLFALNTLGNLLAFNSLETWMFTPITLILSILSLRLALE